MSWMWTFTLHYQGRLADKEMEERPKVVGPGLEVEVSRWESYYRLNIVNTASVPRMLRPKYVRIPNRH